MNLKGKKLLILAGASVHCKLVEAAKEMGIYTIVADYLDSSPAKELADEKWLVDINDVGEIVKRCRENYVDGVITGWIDPCQRPYYQICKKLSLPCYGTEEQFYKMTDKHAFKKMCIDNGVGIIPEYTESEVENGNVEYPVFIKPVDSRGSRGQTICHTKEEALEGIRIAKQESSNGDILIEKYIADKNSFQVTYFYVNGKPSILRTVDGYKGLVEEKLDKVALCSISPSIYTDAYMVNAHEKVLKMFSNLGLQNGPAMLQGFYDDGTFRFYDPGLRFPGVDFDRIYKAEYQVDVMKAMVIFAITGDMPDVQVDEGKLLFDGRRAAVLFPTIGAGKIGSINGLTDTANLPQVYSVLPRYSVGDTVEWSFTVRQRLAEIDMIADNQEKLKQLILHIQNSIQVLDTEGSNMIYMPFDVERLEL